MKYFIKTLLYSVIITSCLYLVFTMYYLYSHKSIQLKLGVDNGITTTLVYSILLGLSGSYTASFLQRVIPGPNKIPKRYLFYVLITQIFAPLVVFSTNYILQVWINKKSFALFLSQIRWENYLLPTVISLLIGSGFYAFGVYMEYKNREIEKQKKIAEEVTAQLESLKNQIDPHFLFNSLNVLIGLIEENQKNAITYTQSLAQIYRYVLEQKEQSLVPVSAEIQFAQHYIALLQLRFENAIQVSIHSTELPEQVYTVPLALQLLLENCVQHNKISEEQPLHIRIAVAEGYLIIENNLQKKAQEGFSTKLGLANIKERYKLLSSKEVIIHESSSDFQVKLPLLNHA